MSLTAARESSLQCVGFLRVGAAKPELQQPVVAGIERAHDVVILAGCQRLWILEPDPDRYLKFVAAFGFAPTANLVRGGKRVSENAAGKELRSQRACDDVSIIPSDHTRLVYGSARRTLLRRRTRNGCRGKRSGVELRNSWRGSAAAVAARVHGRGPDWKYIFKEAPAGFRVIAPDLWGHGASTNPSGNFHSGTLPMMCWRCYVFSRSIRSRQLV